MCCCVVLIFTVKLYIFVSSYLSFPGGAICVAHWKELIDQQTSSQFTLSFIKFILKGTGKATLAKFKERAGDRELVSTKDYQSMMCMYEHLCDNKNYFLIEDCNEIDGAVWYGESGNGLTAICGDGFIDTIEAKSNILFFVLPLFQLILTNYYM